MNCGLLCFSFIIDFYAKSKLYIKEKRNIAVMDVIMTWVCAHPPFNNPPYCYVLPPPPPMALSASIMFQLIVHSEYIKMFIWKDKEVNPNKHYFAFFMLHKLKIFKSMNNEYNCLYFFQMGVRKSWARCGSRTTQDKNITRRLISNIFYGRTILSWVKIHISKIKCKAMFYLTTQ